MKDSFSFCPLFEARTRLFLLAVFACFATPPITFAAQDGYPNTRNLTRYSGEECDSSGKLLSNPPDSWVYQYVDSAKQIGIYKFSGVGASSIRQPYFTQPVRLLKWASGSGFSHPPFFQTRYRCSFSDIAVRTSNVELVLGSAFRLHLRYSTYYSYHWDTSYATLNPSSLYFVDTGGSGVHTLLDADNGWAHYDQDVYYYPFIKYLGPYSYASNSILTEVEIPEGVTHIEEGAFRGCGNLTSVVLPSTLEEVGNLAFADCATLSSLTIPEGCSNFSATAFLGCPRNLGLDRSGGTGGTAAVTGRVGEPLPRIVPPTRTGYSFGGYWTGPNGTGTQWYDASGTGLGIGPSLPNATLLAAWTPNAYSVSYDYAGGSSDSGGLAHATYGLPFPVSAPVRDGYVFWGWTVSDGLNTATAKWGETYLSWNDVPNPSAVCGNGSGERVWFLNLTPTPNGAVKLPAVWKRNTYDVAYDLNGGDVFAGSIPKATLGVPFPVPAPVRNGYSFSGWKISRGLAPATARWGATYLSWTPIPNAETACANGPDGKVWFLDISQPEGSATLTATWKKENTYDVVYDLNGGEFVVGSISNATYGLPFPVHAPIRKGHSFAGWTISGGLNPESAKWGKTYSSWTPVVGEGTLCENGVDGDVWFLDLAAPYDTVLIMANWEEITTSESPAAVPYAWLDDNAASLLAAHGGDYEAAANAMAANGLNEVWECYVAGIDPEAEKARFIATISMDAGGKPVVAHDPPLTEEEESKRTYRVLGKKTLAPAEEWTDVTDVPDLDAAGWRFFKVKVEMR